MLQTTSTAITAMLRADPSLTAEDRATITAALRNHGRPARTDAGAPEPARVLRRGEVAKRLGVTTRTIDTLAAQGVLKRLSFPGRVRGCGFRECDVLRLVGGVA